MCEGKSITYEGILLREIKSVISNHFHCTIPLVSFEQGNLSANKHNTEILLVSITLRDTRHR